MSETKEFELVVGLEVHCRLKTKTKLFCSCSTDASGAAPSGDMRSAPQAGSTTFLAAPNSRICPVCTGQPGALPVLNGKAVELAFQAALALGCKLRETSIFARKNYFYPDLPKGYQISQYEEPFSQSGSLEIPGPPARTIGIHRVHIEEDAGKLLHAIGSQELAYSLVDFNRAGTPLIEIVSEPELRSAEEAHQYLSQLKAILQYVGVSNCDMEKGEMRCDANVSIRPRGESAFGTRAEIKNMNSFKSVRDAIDYEFQRQREVVSSGGRVVQETRLWDAERGVTESMRSKEEAHDYRYFPDPDLAPLTADAEFVSALRAALPELPAKRRARFRSQYNIPEQDAAVLTAERNVADYYEACVAACGGKSAKSAANWIMTDLLGKLNAGNLTVSASPIRPQGLGEMIGLIDQGVLSGKLAKEVFSKMWETGKPAGEIVSILGLSQISDEGQIAEWVKAAVAENPKAVQDLRSGKEKAVGAIVGSVMKKSKGKANPGLVARLIQEQIK